MARSRRRATAGEPDVLAIPQIDDGIDQLDRVIVGAELVKQFTEAGL